MKSIHCATDNFSSSNGYKMIAKRVQKKRMPNLINCIAFKEILSPISNENNSETSTQTDISSNDSIIIDEYGQISLSPTLYTSKSKCFNCLL